MDDTLDPLNVALRGSHLIEASAGTGKTWTIAALYLRLVLGHGCAFPLAPAEILVVTFTVAATRELSERIRARLVEAARCFRGEREADPDDGFLRALVDAHPAGDARTAAAWRLATAAEAMDDSAVHTIDAWCQRMLREHAVDSGSLFDEELLVDEFAFVDDAVRDYWRQNVYPLDADALGRVHDVWKDVGTMIGDVRELIRHDGVEADPGASLDDVRVGVEGDAPARMRGLRAGWVERADAMQRWFDEQLALSPSPLSGSKIRVDWPAKRCGALRAWALSSGVTFPALEDAHWYRLSPAGLRDAAKGKATIDPPPWSAETVELRAALATFVSPAAAMRRHAAASVRHRVAELKRHAGTPGFRDLLERLAAALDGPNGDRLRARIVAQFPAALIDEFQDTSPLQYRIFDRVYRIAANDPATVLFLIGDPKQSIFAFRGADIRSYLRARDATAGRHHRLGVNHRSTQALVAAVNRLFTNAEAFDGGAFRFGGALDPSGPSPLPFVPVEARGRRERFVASSGSVPAITVCVDAAELNVTDTRRVFADRAASRIVSWLADPACGFDDPEAGFRRLAPADIAVIVRTGKEAAAVQGALRRRRVASVYLSDRDSVFAGPEAKDLVRWLLAVATPLDSRRVRAAFATPLAGLSTDALGALAHDDVVFESRVELLRRLKAVWARQGVLPMLRQALHALDLPARWLSEPDGGERKLTNVLHLAELLQAASAEVEGEETLIRWLVDQTAAEHGGEDEHLVRLESDADLIQVVTVYKSKGLEYPVVVLPYAATFHEAKAKNDVIAVPEGDGGRRIVFDPSQQDVADADLARLQEEIRLLYVALTRARHALWIGVSPPKGKGGNALQLTALGHLLDGGRRIQADALGALLDAATAGLASVVVDVADSTDEPVVVLDAGTGATAFVDAPDYTTRFETDWTIGSFSSLVRDLSRAPLAITPASPSLEEELLAGVTDEPPAPPGARAPRHRFPRGALPGNFLHEQLQWLAASGFALATDPGLAERLRLRCERQGWGHRADDVVAWLGEVATTVLPPLDASLAALRTLLPEMEFWFPSGGPVDAARIDALCVEHLLGGRPRPPLARRTLNGMVMGFADLVFEHGGRYWVLDYKSNALGDDDAAYHHDALETAMATHRYDVQAAIYLLALHRLLRSRLGPAYVPERDLGGAVYLFLRGIRGPERGCCVVRPPTELLDALDAALSACAAPAQAGSP